MANLTLSSPSLLQRLIEGMNRALQWWLFELGDILRIITWSKKPKMLVFEIENDEPIPGSKVKPRSISGRKNISLKLADRNFLYRKIKLPMAARKNFDRVIHYEFNKYFPIDAEDAFFSSRIIQPKVGAASIEIEIWAIPKALVNMYLSMIQQNHPIEIRKLALLDNEDRELITLDIEKAQRLENGAEYAGFERVLGLVVTGLVLAMVIYPVSRMDSYLAQQKQNIASLEKQAQPVIELRKKILALDKRFQELVEKKMENPDQAYLWSYITKAVADKAILEQLQINGRKVQISGKSPSVEKLIRSLESEPQIAEVKIAGQVTSSKDNRFEIMKLNLTIRE